jgi:predicted lipoprotein with Yx(FWY)xxD motif
MTGIGGRDGRRVLVLRLVGAALLAATGGIHLDLYLTGYNTIPTIGWLFLLQIISAFALAAAVALSGNWLVSASGAGFAVATLGGYLLSIWVGLFGFTEVRTTAGIVAGVIEVATFGVLAAASIAANPDTGPAALLRQPAARLTWATAGVAIVALALLGAAAGTAGGSGAVTASGGLRTTTIGGARVLTNAKGLTLYWFAPDSTTASTCYGSCAVYWPPVKGPVTAGAGIPGRLGTIKRTDGSVQATYDGHPLYTYIADHSPGEAHGNNVKLNGGVWHEVTVSG